MHKMCQNCKKDFVIDERDQDYYKKIGVPAPSWCPRCRLVRRIANINGWSLWYRNCDKCGTRTLSMYPPEQKITVWCQPCWWGDDWDGTEYAMEYDSSRPFLEQVKELNQKTPHVALETTYLTLKNCDYSNALAYSKNCVLATWADYCENVYFSSFLNGAKDCADCLRTKESELCYESTGQYKNYRVFFSEETDSCNDVWFSRNCYGCTNCIGCVNLRGASYQIFNEQYTKEQYEEKVKEMRLDTHSGIQAVKKEAQEFWKKFPHRAYTGNTFNVNVSGEYVYESKNSYDLYMCSGTEDSRYCQFITVAPGKDCMDYSGWGNGAELIYESANIGDGVNNVKFSYYCFPDNLNNEYCMWDVAGKNNFGCVNLKRKQYAILNKEYSKEEYEKLVEEIKKDMTANPYTDSQGRVYPYGEFFAPEFSNFAYNRSNANKFLPKTQEEAVKEGYFWNEEDKQEVRATINGGSLSETIAETTKDILKEVIECTRCSRKYRIVEGEYDLLKKMDMPPPRECPKCREDQRFAAMHKPLDSHMRTCSKCSKEIETAYAPSDPRIVYCVDCYQQEFV